MDPSRSFPKSGAVAMEKVLTDDIVYMTANLNSKIRTSQRGRRRFHLSKEKFVLQGLGVACRTGAPFIQKFNEVLLKINQGGLVDKWINDALRKLSGASGSEGNTGVRESLALTLNHLQAAFFILFGGSILAGVTLILEILASTSCTKSSEKGI
ncbi:uncharacterized protein LOC135222286 [Macrobrachium nipponense]|uniref:uncharacterized protein LOC135222286 n=1 Tax=Macrobrachium nipponense TaxID=159736 RepID=UPI0030C88CD8